MLMTWAGRRTARWRCTQLSVSHPCRPCYALDVLLWNKYLLEGPHAFADAIEPPIVKGVHDSA